MHISISIGMMYKEIFLNHQISIIGNSKAFETYSTYLKAVFIKISKELDRLCVKLWLTLYSSIAMQSKLTKLTGNLPSAHNFRTLQEQVVLVTSISLKGFYSIFLLKSCDTSLAFTYTWTRLSRKHACFHCVATFWFFTK